MTTDLYFENLIICERHAGRLEWSMKKMGSRLPFTAESINCLTDMEVAILDQFATRFAKLQDMMGVKLFPAILELTKEPGDLNTFVDKLNRLEKIGAIPSAHRWLILREIRNAFSHEYPDEPAIQAAILNKAFILAKELIETLNGVKVFADRYI